MKSIYVLACAFACAVPGVCSAQTLGEEGAWQFRSPAERSVAASVAALIEAREEAERQRANGGFSSGGSGGGGGGASGTAATTNNYFQYVDQSQTTNNCSSSGGVGSPISCGGGSTSLSGVSQVSSGNTNSARNELTGNTVTFSGNTTNNTANNGNGNSNTTTNAAPRAIAVGTPIGN